MIDRKYGDYYLLNDALINRSMKFKSYLQKTVSKGSYLTKFVKLGRFIQHCIYFILKREIGEYAPPPESVSEIGFFDKNRFLHTEHEFKPYFNPSNLYKEGDFVHMKPGQIALAKSGDRIMVKKTFMGLKGINEFYTELVSLHRLRDISGTPEIVFVDYNSCTIYMDYIDGVVVKWERASLVKEADQIYSGDPLNEFHLLLKNIHDRKVIVYDLKGSNMLLSKEGCHLIDFGGAVYFGPFLSRWIEKRKLTEVEKLEREVEMFQKSRLRMLISEEN